MSGHFERRPGDEVVEPLFAALDGEERVRLVSRRRPPARALALLLAVGLALALFFWLAD